ncbi:hypothetical protein H0H92_001601 [Tricholoma furcatifolium]|nr:hypothetical protein H0H92_001601 [Tricholoma furcatifolium]
MPLPPTPLLIEEAADRLLAYGVGVSRSGWVIIRSGALGSYVKSLNDNGMWVSAFWTADDHERVIDVTGAGNSFLGGLAAGLLLTGDVARATFYASVSASFIIEQEGLPTSLADGEHRLWNGDIPHRRLEALLARHEIR